MILYYALGGGLGHLTRARAVLHTLSIRDRVVILASSPFARDPRVTGEREVILVPAEVSGDQAGYSRWLAEQMDRLSPSKILLDTFPAGIIGEFCDLSFSCRPALIHIARLLRWHEYSKQLRGEPPSLDLTYMVEPLAPEHEDYLRAHSLEAHDLVLDNLQESPSREALEAADRLRADEKPVWLIVHSGPDDETLEIVSYAREMMALERADPRLVVIAPSRPHGLDERVIHLDLFPASSLYPMAARIITGCGFNAMRETELYREKHRFIPFTRRFDDQFRRAALRKNQG